MSGTQGAWLGCLGMRSKGCNLLQFQWWDLCSRLLAPQRAQTPAPLCSCPCRAQLPRYPAQVGEAGGQGCRCPVWQWFLLGFVFNTGFLLATPYSLESLTPGCICDVLTLGETGTVDVCVPPEKSWGLTSEGSPGDVLAPLSETSFVTSDPLPLLFPKESILHGLLLQMDDLKIKCDKIQISD